MPPIRARPRLALKCTRVRRLTRELPSVHRRFNATNATAPGPAAAVGAAPTRRISLRAFVYALLFFSVGATGGSLVRQIVLPPAFPEAGSAEDVKILERISRDIDALPIVAALRAETYHFRSDTDLQEHASRVEQGQAEAVRGWRELDADTLGGKSAIRSDSVDCTRTLTQRTLLGGGRLGVQRAFWNPTTRELIAVIWFGGGLSGWPGMAHGGAIATVFDEGMSRVLAGPDASLDSVPSPKSLSLTYVKPTLANNFYVLRASFPSPDVTLETPYTVTKASETSQEYPSNKDMTKKVSASEGAAGDCEIVGTIETLEGQVCVKSKAVFPGHAAGAGFSPSVVTSAWGRFKNRLGF